MQIFLRKSELFVVENNRERAQELVDPEVGTINIIVKLRLSGEELAAHLRIDRLQLGPNLPRLAAEQRRQYVLAHNLEFNGDSKRETSLRKLRKQTLLLDSEEDEINRLVKEREIDREHSLLVGAVFLLVVQEVENLRTIILRCNEQRALASHSPQSPFLQQTLC